MNFDSSVLQVAIEDIIPNRNQPRSLFDDDSLQDLADSIKTYGIIQPLVLRRVNDKYEIVAGERRYRAAIKCGLVSVPAVITKIDEKLSAQVAIAENVQRRELTSIEEARSYKALLDQGYMDKEMLANRMGIPISSLESKLSLLNLSKEVQDAVTNKQISERHAKSLLVIKDQEKEKQWLDKIIKERITVRQLDEELKKEYNMDNQNVVSDINETKLNAAPMEAPDASDVPAAASMEAVDLGQKSTGKFFNNLENESANMQMTDTSNPLDLISPSLASPAETIDSLDFGPGAPDTFKAETNTPAPKDMSVVDQKIDSLVEELKALGFNLNLDKSEQPGQKTYTLSVKSE